MHYAEMRNGTLDSSGEKGRDKKERRGRTRRNSVTSVHALLARAKHCRTRIVACETMGSMRMSRVKNALPSCASNRLVRVFSYDDILRVFEENPCNSTRSVARRFNTSQHTVLKILHENGLHPFHFQRVQQLLARDERQRIYFCEGIFLFIY